MMCRMVTYYTDSEIINITKKCVAEIANLRKLKTTQEIMPDTLC